MAQVQDNLREERSHRLNDAGLGRQSNDSSRFSVHNDPSPKLCGTET